MAERKILDRRPGAMPEIRSDGDSVTFHLDVAATKGAVRLIIRCDADGSVWASIATRREADE